MLIRLPILAPTLIIQSRYLLLKCVLSDVVLTNTQVEASGLKAFTTYYYGFNICNSNNKSPVGRTKTSPAADDTVSQLALAVYSCSNYPFGFFVRYRSLPDLGLCAV